MKGNIRDGRRALPLAWVPLAALGATFLWALLASSGAADTFITNTSTDQILVLDPSGSPYIISQDFHVLAGGFVLIGEGVDLQFDNGARIIGDAGAISAIGTESSLAVLRPRPGGNASVWGGIQLYNGTTLTLRWADLRGADPLITTGGIATVDVRNTTARGCGAWCVKTSLGATLDLRDSTFFDGEWGLIEAGAVDPRAENVTFRNFSQGGLSFGASSTGGLFSSITVETNGTGVRADGLRATSIGPLTVLSTDAAAVELTGGVDVLLHHLSLSTSNATALVVSGTSRVLLQGGDIAGAGGAVSLSQAVAPSVQNLTLHSTRGVCLTLANVTNGLLRGNALGPCERSIVFDSNSPPNTADVDTSNTVDGKAVWWMANKANVNIGAADNPGFVALFTVTGANLTDLRLSGAGISVFGSSDVRVERVQVDRAEAGVDVVGSQRLDIVQLVTSNVTYGVRVRASAFYPQPLDIKVDHTRSDNATGAGVRMEGTRNATILASYVSGPGAGVELVRVEGALLARLVIVGASTGVSLTDCLDITVVDSLLANSTAFGLWTTNSTGHASRNSFVANAEHAAAPLSPGFEWNETGSGNYWSGFTAPDVGGDGFADWPYNLTDGNGVDYRPRLSRLDFPPVAILRVPGLLEIGVNSTMDASLSFDDFQVADVYWEIDLPGANFTDSGMSIAWGADAGFVGLYDLRVSVVGSFGALDEVTMTFRVVDTTAPTFSVALAAPAEAGANATIVIVGSSDNDPAFPTNISVSWVLRGPSGILRSGTSANVTFPVPVALLGAYNVTVTLRDGFGNGASRTFSFDVFDTLPPEVLFAYTGEPDLGVPFEINASESHDPTGLRLNGSNAPIWSWIDGAVSRTSSSWPSVRVIFNSSGPHDVVLLLCDERLNCATATLTLTAADRSAPVLQVLRVLAPGRDTVEVRAGQNVVAGGKINEDIVFEAVALDAAGNITYTWDFGDGTTAEGSRVAHRFTRVGPVSVSVTMRDGAGNANVSAVVVDLQGGGIFGGLAPGFEAVLAVAAAGAAAVAAGRRRKP